MLKTPPSSAIVAGVLWAILMLTVGVSSASGANEAVAALPREAVLTYDLKLGGFDVGTAEVAIALPASATTGGPYRIAANITTAGVVSIFTDFHTRASSDGAIADARVRPRRHEVNNVWRGEVRKVTLRYDDATPAPEAQVTPPPDAEDRDPIPVADTVGSVDPLSGILQLVADADSETAPVKIFDGRRLYTLALFDPRPASVDMPGWRGPAVRAVCGTNDSVAPHAGGTAGK